MFENVLFEVKSSTAGDVCSRSFATLPPPCGFMCLGCFTTQNRMVCLLVSVLKAGGRSDVMSGGRDKEGSRYLKIGVMFHSINFIYHLHIVFPLFSLICV